MPESTLVNQRYRILHTLGEGGFGQTFLAEDTQMPSGRHCVLKQLKPVNDDPPTYQLIQERFQREAAILEELGTSHRQIPTLYAYFQEDNFFYLVQEWIEGETLSNYIQKNGPMRESTVRPMLVSLLSLLEYIHQKQIIHRDIKPDNIILRSDQLEPVLLDFGAVKETMGTVLSESQNPTKSVVVGTPGFMPSEQSIGRPMFNSDLYALGLVGILALTGKTPQEFSSDPSTGNLIWRPEVPQITPSFANVLECAIQSHPRDRFASAREMREALDGNAGVPATVVSSPQANSLPATQVSAPPSTPATAYPTTPPTKTGMTEWQKAVLSGGIIGVSIVAGLAASLFVLNNQNGESDGVASSSNSTNTETEETETNSQANSSASTPTQPTTTPQPTTPSTQSVPSPSPTSSISRSESVALVKNWLQAKPQMFAPPYSKEPAYRLTTGSLLSDLLKSDGPIGWLRNNNSYYRYGVQRVDGVNRFVASSDRATLEVMITEEAALYRNGRRDPNSSYFTNSLFRYSIVQSDGRLKIADYQKVE